MANYTPQQRQSMDAMISGSFNAVGAPAPYLSPPTSVDEMYKGILPASRGPTPAQLAAIRDVSKVPNLSASSSRLASGWPWQPGSETALAAIEGVAPTPRRQNPAVLSAMMASGGVPLPRRRPGGAPTRLDMQGINQLENIGGVPLPEFWSTGPGAATRTAQALRARQGLPPAPPPPTTIIGSSTGRQLNIGQTYQGTNGYSYLITPQGPVQVGTPVGGGAAAYNARIGGPGSVAAMEQQHSGRPAGSYTDGREPSGTGSLW